MQGIIRRPPGGVLDGFRRVLYGGWWGLYRGYMGLIYGGFTKIRSFWWSP